MLAPPKQQCGNSTKAADKWDSDSYLATVVAGWNMQDNKMFLVQTAYSFSRMRQLGRKERERETVSLTI